MKKGIANTKENGNENRNTKGFSSVLMLYACSSIYKLMLIVAVMIVLESVCFIVGMSSGTAAMGFEEVLYSVRIPLMIIIAVAYAAFCFCLGTAMTASKARPEYTIRRLGISEKGVFAAGCLYNTVMFIVFYGAQVAAFLIMMRLYQGRFPENVSPQIFFAACCRLDLMYSFLPLPSAFEWIRNGLRILILGVLASANGVKMRTMGRSYTFMFAALIEGAIFIRGMSNQMLWILPSAIVIIMAGYDILYCLSDSGVMEDRIKESM